MFVVYRIDIGGKFYIGSSCSYLRRQSSHRCELQRKVHANFKLQDLFNAGHQPTFSILEECKSMSTMLRTEQRMIWEMWSHPDILNLSADVSTSGAEVFKRPVNQIDMVTLEVVAVFDSLTNAANSVGGKPVAIGACCRGERLSHKKYFWAFHGDVFVKPVYADRGSTPKPITQWGLSGNKVRDWNSAREAARTLKIDSGAIRDTCTGKRRQYKGFAWTESGEPFRLRPKHKRQLNYGNERAS